MKQRQGFSLVEMIVLVGIIGLALAFTMPNFASYVRSNRLASSVDRLAADLSLARSLAVSNSRVYRLDAGPAGYTISDINTGEVLREREYERNVELAGDVSVNFFPWGMADEATLNLSNESGNRRIIILPTGIVEVQ